MRIGRRRTRAAPVDPASFGTGGPLGPNTIDPMVRAFMSGAGFGSSPYFSERLGAVNRCLQLASQQISTMPLRYKGKSPQPQWVTQPDPEIYNGISDALFAATWSRYSRGETFLYCTSRYASGFPATFVVLDAVTMRVEQDDYGAPSYWSNGVPLQRTDVLHVKRDPRAGLIRGTPALEAYWSNLASAWSSEMFAADVFNKSGVPSTVLKWQNKLTEGQAKALQDQWVTAVASRVGAPAVLDQGLDLTILSFSPRDLMLLELREFDTKQIASAFGVPAFLLNMPQAGGLNYSNPAQLFDIWWRAELMPAGHQIEVALSSWLPAGNWVEFDPSVVLRPDLPAMAQTWCLLLDKGVVTQDEVRAAVLDLPPLSEGEAIALIDEPASSDVSHAQLQAVQ